MLKTSTLTTASAKANGKIVMDAFHKHTLVKIRTKQGKVIGPGYIAIMYGEVAFRLYSEPVNHGSYFLGVEEEAEVLPAHDEY